MKPQLQSMLQQAIQAFQEGHFERSDSLLKRVIQVDAKCLPALQILGLINASQLKFTEAAHFLARAARINPNDPSIQYNLAKSLMDSGSDKESIPHHKKATELSPNNPKAWLNYGRAASNIRRYEDALTCFSKALSLNPNFAEAALNKGATLKDLKRYDEAIEFADKALGINPNFAEAWSNKAVALKELKRYDEAIAHYDKALSLKPDYAHGWFNKGAALQQLKRYDEAIAHYDKALSIMPDYAEGWGNKGDALFGLKRYDEAITHYDKALSLQPHFAEALGNKGNTLKELKRYDQAIAYYDEALSLKPDYAEGWRNKGIVLQELKRYDEAIALYDKALSLKPDCAETWTDTAVLQLFLKQYQDGWKKYEWRLKRKDFQLETKIEGPKLWNGSGCKHLLVLTEQGVGDIIFYASILGAAKSRVENITISMDIRLLPILSRSFPKINFIDDRANLDASLYDAQIPFGSLPVVMNMHPEMADRKVPYVVANDVLTKSLMNSPCQTKRLKCGVAWKSNNQKMGKDKSILLSDLNEIFKVDGYEFINLQYGDTQKEIEDLEKHYGVKLRSIDGIDLFNNIDGLLSIIQTCDFIVTTSNVTAHLAGALGKATFLLVPYSVGRIWYWHEEAISSWYPSISLYSQDKNFEWNDAIKEIAFRLNNEIVK